MCSTIIIIIIIIIIINFVWNFGQWWHARWCIRYSTVLFEVLRNAWNLTKKLVFWLILRGFLFMPSEIFVYTLWVTLKDFAKWKTLLWYILLSKFINIAAYVLVKFSYWFNIHKMSPFGGFLSSFSTKYSLILLKFWREIVIYFYIVWQCLKKH